MFLGTTKKGEDLVLPTKALTTHIAVLGSTGSGKTGLILNITEELQKNNIPVLLVDIKGDMINIALRREYAKVHCITPGGTHGEMIDILNDLKNPDKVATIVSAILSMVGEDPNPLTSQAHSYLSYLLNYMPSPTLEDLITECRNPSVLYVGELPVDEAYPVRSRNTLSRKLNNLIINPTFYRWRRGHKLDISKIVESGGVTIYSVAHLIDENEQQFAISYLMDEVLRWTKQQQGSQEPKLVLGIDECVGLLPPYPKNPPTKEPIVRMLKQARAFGVGLMLGTQNPVDIDYKALSNCNTWFVGRMTAKRDRDKVSSAMASAGVHTENAIITMIASLLPRNFIMFFKDKLSIFRTRNTSSVLKGPLMPNDITDMYEEGYLEFLNKKDLFTYDTSTTTFKIENIEIEENIESEEELNEDNNVLNSFIGILLLGGTGYLFIKAFEGAAKWIKVLLQIHQ